MESVNQIILHVDMDAFYASIEMRDNPRLKNCPLIIGAKPAERGVVSTCNYEARKYGVRSGMNIKEAYSLCPNGIYMHPDFRKYHRISDQLHGIWSSYSDVIEYIAFDEAFLDLTNKVKSFAEAKDIAFDLKRRVLNETNLTCSVGIGYSKTAAKLSSEEKKPNGYFEILTRDDFVNLMSDRTVRILPFIGPKTEEKLNGMSIFKVEDIRKNANTILSVFGKRGEWMLDMANGIDNRKVSPYSVSDMKSLSREVTFQTDISDREFLREVSFLLSIAVYERLKFYNFSCGGISVKATYYDMKKVSRQKKLTNEISVLEIYKTVKVLLDKLENIPIRLIGIRLYDLHLLDEDNSYDNELSGEELEMLSFLSRQYNYDFLTNKSQIYDVENLHSVINTMHQIRFSYNI